jgi:ATP-binding cassette subfamily B protein
MTTASSSALGGEATTDESALHTVRRGLGLTPHLLRGLWITLLLAVIATAGKVVVPITVQTILDRGIIAPDTPDLAFVSGAAALAALVLLVTALCNVVMNRRLFRLAETSLATLRTRAFRHIHDLSLLTQGTEQRGALVSRVTSDVDTVSQFMSFGGIMLVVMSLQIALATVVMALYSWPLAIAVWICYLPILLIMGSLQKRIRARYQVVRSHVGRMLGAVSESLVGAATVRAYGIEDGTRSNQVARVRDVRNAQFAVLKPQSASFFLSETADGLATAVVVVLGIVLGTGALGLDLPGAMDPHTGTHRAPVPGMTPLPDGLLDIEIRQLRYSYPTGPEVLHGLDVDIPARSRIAIVGETGSGKTTFAKLLTRMMDPTSGEIRIGGVPLPLVPYSSLRSRVIMVPQEGFLFDATVAENLRYGKPDASTEDMRRALDELGLGTWADELPDGLDTPVGQRGEALSAGERQLVALARAYLIDPDVIVLDEATSAVDPAADVRLQQAIDGLARGRTTITIAHRLSTVIDADRIVVLDGGRVAEEGSHAELLRRNGLYADMWARQQAEREQAEAAE